MVSTPSAMVVMFSERAMAMMARVIDAAPSSLVTSKVKDLSIFSVSIGKRLR